jgi:hypothetical protein
MLQHMALQCILQTQHSPSSSREKKKTCYDIVLSFQ